MSDNLPPAKPEQSPLEAVREQQSARDHDEQVTEKREVQTEEPGSGKPSNKDQYPQRQLG